MSTKIQGLIDNIETIQRSFTEPTSIVITDTKQILIQAKASFDPITFEAGTPLDVIPNPLLKESLKSGKVNRAEVNAEEFGIPFIVTWNPVLENQEVVGLIITTTSTESVEGLRKVASELAVTAEEMTATSEQLSSVSDTISDKIQSISNDSELITKMIEDAYQVIKSVQDIANQSKILGLNAAIEAARAGEYGKGFSVVANEIRRMADQSKDSSVSIIGYLEKVNTAINSNNLSIQEIASMSEEHTASLEEFNSSLERIAATADNLMKASEV